MSRKRSDELSVPNLITYFRLLLIPVFLLTYFEERYILALVCLALSGLSDIADGYIARRFNMITNLGKALDPVADKLTQAAMFFCVAWKIPAAWILLGFLAVKEGVMLMWGWLVLRRAGEVHSARWYGKVCTAVLYASVIALVLLPNLSRTGTTVIVCVCGGVMLMSLALYSRWFLRYLREAEPRDGRRLRETSAVRSPAFLAAAWIVFAVLLVCAAVSAAYHMRTAALLILFISAAPLAFSLWLCKHHVGRKPNDTEDTTDEYTE